MIGQPIEILIPARFHEDHPKYRNEFIAHPAVRPMGSGRDLFGRRKDGTEFPVEIGLNPVETEKGTMILGTVVDITERKQIEDALRASEGRLRIVTDNARVGLVMINRDRRYTFANNAYAEILNLPTPDILGLHVAEVLGSVYESQVAPKLDRAFGGERVAYELHRRNSDGYRHYAVSYEPMQTETEESLVVVVITDITERKQAEEELARQRAQLRVIFDNMTEGITVLDRDRNIVEANAAGLRIQKMTGSDLDPLAAANVFDVIGPDGKLIPVEQWPSSRAFRGDFVQDYELALRRRDSGVQINLELNSAPIITASGETGQIMLSMRDVTQRRQTEARYRTLFEHAPDGIAITSSAGTYLEVNPSYCRMLGYERSELVGMHSSEVLAPAVRSQLDEALNSIRTGTPYPREWLLKRKDGSVFPVDIIATVMPDGNLLGVVRDITQRKLSEERLNEQARMLDLATVLVRDLEGRLIFWNSGAAQMYGWSESEAVGRITHELLGTEFPLPVERIREQVVKEGSWEGELVHYRRDGSRINIASHWILHRDSAGNPKAIIEVNSDITAQKNAEIEVRRLNAQLETRVEERTAELQAVNKELEAFSYSVSHDLRAPLRHINGFSMALLEDYGDQLDDEGKGYLNEVRAASQEMAQLIDDVLQLARVTRSEMIREEVDLTALAEKTVTALRAAESTRAVTIDIEPGLLVRGDKRLLQIMLTNLVGNAWKFTSKTEGARISLTREVNEGETVFCVRDNGAGFDQTFTDKLFRAFQRLHTGAEFEGTGIGLATVQRIVNRHGGRVWAQGKVGEGASFFFTLPER